MRVKASNQIQEYTSGTGNTTFSSGFTYFHLLNRINAVVYIYAILFMRSCGRHWLWGWLVLDERCLPFSRHRHCVNFEVDFDKFLHSNFLSLHLDYSNEYHARCSTVLNDEPAVSKFVFFFLVILKTKGVSGFAFNWPF